MGRDLIIVSGAIGRCSVGGPAWCYMQYLAGLKALGFEVVYLEDCGEESWVYNWETEQLTTDLEYPASYVRASLEQIGLRDNWIYRAGADSRGMPLDDFLQICSEASLLLIYADPLTVWRPEYDRPRRRAYIDGDPGFTQISLLNQEANLRGTVEECETLFTVGQRIGSPDCQIPADGRQWLKTRHPVSLPNWPYSHDGAGSHFTSVMKWRGFRDVLHNGVVYGQKDKEFPKFMDLPRQTTQPFLIASLGAPADSLAECGWEVIQGEIPSRTPSSYQKFIRQSRAEFGVAKHGYVAMRGGWLGDRTVCYLASGRPVLLQDTGLTDWLPIGEGIFVFRDVPEALRAIEAINANYPVQRKAARALAEEYFAAGRVLPVLLEQAMN